MSDCRRLLLLAVGVALLLAGCVQTPGSETAASNPATTLAERPTVVALIDTGINPYHTDFLLPPGGADLSDKFVPNATVIRLSNAGDWKQREATDASFWEGAKAGTLYHFAGTRILSISFGKDPGTLSILDQASNGQGHGSGTADIVAREDPSAIIVMIQVDTTNCPSKANSSCLISPSIAHAMAWAASQPWVDVISVSLGVPGNPPDSGKVHPELTTYLQASLAAAQNGKLLVAGAGNELGPTVPGYFAGPPWVIAAGGAQPKRSGEEITASKAVDVVANYTETVADANTLDGHHWTDGTSFSAPNVAGVLARALFEVRSRLHDSAGITNPSTIARGSMDGAATKVSPQQLRDALNATSVYWKATDWNDLAPVSNDTVFNVGEQTAPILVAPAQVGWGYVNGTIVPALVQRVLSGDSAVPAEKGIAVHYQEQFQALREQYWSRVD